MTRMHRQILISLVALACSSIILAQQSTSQTLKFTTPSGWREEKTTSTMRATQYKWAKADGDSDDGSLVIYFFGTGQGGGTAANVERWINQMKQPDGSESK